MNDTQTGPPKSRISIWSIALIVGVLVFLAVFLYPIFMYPGLDVLSPSCLSNIKQLGLSMVMFCQDHDGAFPGAHTWAQDIYPYEKNRKILFCPQAENKDLPSYAMNGSLTGKNCNQLKEPDGLIGLFDSIPGDNLSGGKELLTKSPRHGDGDNYAFADSHAKWYPRERSPRGKTAIMEWQPEILNPRNHQPSHIPISPKAKTSDNITR